MSENENENTRLSSDFHPIFSLLSYQVPVESSKSTIHARRGDSIEPPNPYQEWRIIHSHAKVSLSMNTQCLYLVVPSLVVALSSLCYAQPDVPDTIEFQGSTQHLPALNLNPSGTPTYAPRALVYDASTDAFTSQGANFQLTNSVHIMDDLNFAGGPWSVPFDVDRVITSLTCSFANFGASPVNFDLVLRFWSSANITFTSVTGNAINAIDLDTGLPPEPFYTLILQVQNAQPGSIFLQPIGGLSIAVPDFANVVVEAGVYQPGFDVIAPTPLFSHVIQTASLFGTTNGGQSGGVQVGSTSNSWMRDRNNNGIFASGPVAAPPGEHNISNVTYPGPPSGSRALTYPISLVGEIIPTQPPSGTPLNACGNPVASTFNLGAGEVRWHTIDLCGDAEDISRQFVDFYTQGGDADLALYSGIDGARIAIDRSSNGGDDAQLTFGVGNRTGFGGNHFDGRHGELVAGTYYLAVSGPGALFGGRYQVVGGGPSTNVTLTARGNTNGSPLSPSVPPFVIAGNDLGEVISPYIESIAQAPGQQEILWFTFTTNFDATGFNPCRFVDISFVGAGGSMNADTEAFVFDSSGQLLTADDDNGPALLSQLSFGGSGSIPPRSALGGDGVVFDAQNGDLPAGTYYLGVGLFDTRALTAGDRWHLRSASGSSANVALIISTDFDGTNPGCCPVCPADYNQDGGIDGQDVEAFFTAFEAGEPCADVNYDGGVTGDDVAAFFIPFESGGC